MTASSRCPRCGAELDSSRDGEGTAGACASCGHAFEAERSGGATVSHEHLATVTRRLWGPLIAAGASPTTSLGSRQSPSSVVERVRLREQHVATGAGEGDHCYELLDELGRGGMGVVVGARQASLDRLVALKLRRDEAGPAEERDRFVAEAIVTGSLDHPNIVPVHDLGVDADGRPFYAMKWVRGTPWNEVLRARSREANLETLLRVCDAVAFAHSRGVIHRDLKPHNVMLGDFGEVLVMDWGLAVTIEGGALACPLSTSSATAGTAAYMAPEMALGRIDRIGVRSDVYLLGAILFEIATGRPPHSGHTVYECLLAAAENVIREVEDDDELLEVARRAMASDPDERHAGVAELQADIRSYLAHAESRALAERAHLGLELAEAGGGYEELVRLRHTFEQALELWSGNVAARTGATKARRAHARIALANRDLDLAASLLDPEDPEERPLVEQVERARRARDSRRRRMRLLAGTAASLGVVLALSLVGGAIAVRSQRDRALRAEAAAAVQRNLALETLDTIVFEVVAELEKRPAMHRLREQLLRRAIAGLNKVASSGAEEAPVDRRLAAAHRSMARIFHAARRQHEAIEHQRIALSILAPLADAEHPPGEATIALAVASREMGEIVANHRMGDLERALRYHRRALELLEPFARGESVAPSVASGLAETYRALGDSELDLERTEEAYDDYRLAVEWSERAAGGAGTGEVVDVTLHLGDAAFELSRWDEARRCYRRALAEADRLAAETPGDPAWPRTAGLAEYDLGDVALASGDLAGAERHLLAARQRQEALATADPSDGQAQRDLLVSVWRIGDLRRRQGQLEAARRQYGDATTIAERLLGLNPTNVEAKRDLFVCCNRYGDTALELGEPDQARQRYQRGLELSSEVAAAAPSNLGAQTDVVVSLYKLGSAARAAGEVGEARRRLGEALSRLKGLVADGRLDQGSHFYPWIGEVESELAALGSE